MKILGGSCLGFLMAYALGAPQNPMQLLVIGACGAVLLWRSAR